MQQGNAGRSLAENGHEAAVWVASHSGGNSLGISNIIVEMQLVRKLADYIWLNGP